MDKPASSEPRLESRDLDRLWQIFTHDDNLLATRVSFFLLAESILIAAAASLINTVTNLTRPAELDLRGEIFGLSIAIILAGLGLTLLFWYIFRLNFDNIGAALDMIRTTDSIYRTAARKQSERRHNHRYFPMVFRKKGMNWITINVLSLGFMLLWCVVGSFSLIIFISH
jgi:hypothetical protein